MLELGGGIQEQESPGSRFGQIGYGSIESLAYAWCRTFFIGKKRTSAIDATTKSIVLFTNRL